MIIFIYGTDTFSSWHKAQELKDKFNKKVDITGSSITYVEGDDFDMSQLRQQLLSSALFSEKRMLIVKNVLASGLDKEQQQQIEDVLARAGDNIVIWWEYIKDKDSYKKISQLPLFLFLKKQKFVQEFNTPTGTNLDKWVQNLAKELGTSISTVAAKTLVAQIGDNLWQLNNELVKISLYTKNKEIGLDDIDTMVRTSLGGDAWDFLYNLSHKNKSEAIKLLEEQISSGTEPVEILTRMVWQFRVLLLIKESLEIKTLTSSELAQNLGLHPYVVQKSLTVVKHFSLAELKKAFVDLSMIDLKIKTGQGNPAALLDLFILDL
jgi:DNA polymerase-3 subunit delta